MLIPAFTAGEGLLPVLRAKIADSFWKGQSMRNYLVYQRPDLLEFSRLPYPCFSRIAEIAKEWGL